jgi:hypothetical protein
MAKSHSKKVTLDDVVGALAEIARWTKAVEDELRAFTPSPSQAAQFAATTGAVTTAAIATQAASGAAQSARGALGNIDLVTNFQLRGKTAQANTAALEAGGALVGKGC